MQFCQLPRIWLRALVLAQLGDGNFTRACIARRRGGGHAEIFELCDGDGHGGFLPSKFDDNIGLANGAIVVGCDETIFINAKQCGVGARELCAWVAGDNAGCVDGNSFEHSAHSHLHLRWVVAAVFRSNIAAGHKQSRGGTHHYLWHERINRHHDSFSREW